MLNTIINFAHRNMLFLSLTIPILSIANTLMVEKIVLLVITQYALFLLFVIGAIKVFKESNRIEKKLKSLTPNNNVILIEQIEHMKKK